MLHVHIYIRDNTHIRESHPQKMLKLCTHRYRSCTISTMQLNTLPETPAQAKPALETTEGKQEDMLACHLDLHRLTEAISRKKYVFLMDSVTNLC